MGLSTAYYTVDGEIIGESTNGLRLDYLTDALGSVTAKVDQTGAVTSTARYKPYGDKLVGSIYTFGWVGAYGYRISAGGIYIRNRTYASGAARWGTRDKLWPNESPYGYVFDNPIVRIDYNGLSPTLTRTRIKSKTFTDADTEPKCGNYAVSWKFKVADKTKLNGWLVQWLTTMRFQANCGEELTDIGCGSFFEVWMVKDGEVYTPGAAYLGNGFVPWESLPLDDTWSDIRGGKCKFGREVTTGFLTFEPDDTVNPFHNDSANEWLGRHNFKRGQLCNPKGLVSKTYVSKDWSAYGSFADDWGCCKKVGTCSEDSLCDLCPTVGKCNPKDDWNVYPNDPVWI